MEQVATQLTEQLDRWKRAVEQEARFAREASHELRTPLAALGGAAELAEAAADDPERVRDLARRMREANDQMQELVSVFLQLGRARTDRADEEWALDEVLFDAIDRLKRQYPEAGELAAELREPGTARGPRALVFAVLRNLLENALTHGVAKTVRIRLSGNTLQVDNEAAADAGSRGHGFGVSIVQRICADRGWRFELAREGIQARATVEFLDEGAAT